MKGLIGCKHYMRNLEVPISEETAERLYTMTDVQKVALAQWLLEQVRYRLRRPVVKQRDTLNQEQRVEGGQWSH